MVDLAKFQKMIQEVEELKKLKMGDPQTSMWVHKVSQFLKQEFGEKSYCYKHFYSMINGRAIGSTNMTEQDFQSKYIKNLEKYKKHLQVCLEDCKEDTGSINKNKFHKELKLHPKIVKASEKLFKDGHYSSAIFEATKILEKEIKLKSKIKDEIGVKLVNMAFNEKQPVIEIIKGQEQEQIDEREGFRFLYMGVFQGIKNPKSHSIQNLIESDKAIEYLAFISLLMKRLDEATVQY